VRWSQPVLWRRQDAAGLIAATHNCFEHSAQSAPEAVWKGTQNSYVYTVRTD
jgi:hypothetical protein